MKRCLFLIPLSLSNVAYIASPEMPLKCTAKVNICSNFLDWNLSWLVFQCPVPH